MANILYFLEVPNIAGVHINMETSKGKLINAHIKNKQVIHFKACAEGIFYTSINYPTMINNPNNVYLNVCSYLSTVKQSSGFLLILKLKDCKKFESYSNIFIGG